MKLQNGGGNLGGNRAEEGLLHDFGLAFAGGDENDFAGGHDGADTHGEGCGGYFIDGVEEALVGLTGAVGQRNFVGSLREVIARLVEADVAVVADAQQL